jgi:hypothetical protein
MGLFLPAFRPPAPVRASGTSEEYRTGDVPAHCGIAIAKRTMESRALARRDRLGFGFIHPEEAENSAHFEGL